MFPGSLVLTSPWLLLFLGALPLLWWLLRLTPPMPKTLTFPALSLLRDLLTPQETPARTPWWLLILRLMIATLIILAFTEPRLDPEAAVGGHGALLIVVDNDWAAARAWETRENTLHDLLHLAERENREVILLPTTPSADGRPLEVTGPITAKAAYAEIERLIPEPWPADWRQARALAEKLDRSRIADAVWLSSGLGNVDARMLFTALQDHGGVRILVDAARPIYLLQPPQNEADQFSIGVLRATTDQAAHISVAAFGSDHQVLAHLPVDFSVGAPHASAPISLPLDLRNQIVRFEIEGWHSAGTTLWLDTGWQRRPVGLVGDKEEITGHSLLNGLFYIDRALKPFADIDVDPLETLLKQSMSVLVITDATQINDGEIPQLLAWIKAGGVLVRFAGERLASAPNPKETELLPVPLRTGDRSLGGAMSWTSPQGLREFPSTSPFHGLEIPADVTVSRQVLAEPSSELASHTWAALADGTPLVSATQLGQGLTILFHVPARSDWSNLSLSGLFVDMLRRITDLSHGVPAEGSDFAFLAPYRQMDAYGEEQKPNAAAQPISSADLPHTSPDPSHPPGLYGTGPLNRALNLGAALGQPEALTGLPFETYKQEHRETDLEPYLLLGAFILLLTDFIASLWLRGLLKVSARSIASAVLLIVWFMPHTASAADTRDFAELSSKTWLAYIETGDRETDRISEAGLNGLAETLRRRTSIAQLGVTGVDPARDDLAFFPLIYWPLEAGEAPLSPQAAQHVNDYLHHGGMILFDSPGGEILPVPVTQHILAGLDLPPLIRLPKEHVLKHSFYLLEEFPGRYDNPDIWLEPEDLSSYDGVATVISGANGWAAAWAVDEAGRPMFPCTPGGELQREYAYRFGVNLVMYALTGNYKSDQLHAEALLQRLKR